jgi:general secretion pathway protein D
MKRRLVPALVSLLALTECAQPPTPLTPLPLVSGNAGEASLRLNGPAGSVPQPPAQYSLAPSANVGTLSPGQGGGGGGDISLNFADTDIREVVAQILGTLLGQNYGARYGHPAHHQAGRTG